MTVELIAYNGLTFQDDSLNTVMTVGPYNLSYQGGLKEINLISNLTLSQPKEGFIYVSDDKAQYTITIPNDIAFTVGISTFFFAGISEKLIINLSSSILINGFSGYSQIIIPASNFGIEFINVGLNSFVVRLVNISTREYIPDFSSPDPPGGPHNFDNRSSSCWIKDVLPDAWVDLNLQYHFQEYRDTTDQTSHVQFNVPFGGNFTDSTQAILVGGIIMCTDHSRSALVPIYDPFGTTAQLYSAEAMTGTNNIFLQYRGQKLYEQTYDKTYRYINFKAELNFKYKLMP